MNCLLTLPILAQTTTPPVAPTWDAETVLTAIALGFLLGAIGQTARVIVGLKKTNDEARASGKPFSCHFEANELVVSLIIGGVAGSLASLGVLDKTALLTKEAVLGLMAAGYAGADFIEGFMRDAGKNQPPNGGAPGGAGDPTKLPTPDTMAALLRESRPGD